MAKRSTKFYRKNEEEVMRSLGLTPTKNSGAGWIEKEDGQNEHVICQLKSTDAQSIRVIQKDIHTLVNNAEITHKLPVFAIQFLNTGEVWLMTRPTDLIDVSKFIKGEKTCSANFLELDIDEHVDLKVQKSNVREVKSSSIARKRFITENEKKYKKERRSAK